MGSVTTMDKKRLIKLLSYFVMGDGGLYKYKNATNAQFIMNMKTENKDYIDFVANTLSTIVHTRQYDRKDYNMDGCNRQPQIRLESNQHPILSVLKDRIYTIDGHKSIDLHALKLLDWESMAILYMSDGCAYEYKRGTMVTPAVNVTLNMKRLSEAEQIILKQAIKDKLGVEFNVNKAGKYYCLRLRTKDIGMFMNNIEPYILPSFKYKVIRTKSPINIGDDIV